MANKYTNAVFQMFRREPAKNSNTETSKTNNLIPLSQDFFRRGNFIATQNLMKDKAQNKESAYDGYLFSALDLRKNSFAEFASTNIITKTENDNLKNPYHPYLKLIENSKTDSEYEFWSDIITDWDIRGEVFLFLLRRVVYDTDENGKKYVSHIGLPTSIEVLDASKISTLYTGSGKVAGYTEMIDATHKREFVPEQIIRIINKNPFDKKTAYSIFDAARDYQYTLRKGTNYTQAVIANNQATPGILSTDQTLNDSEYDNFVSRVNSHEAGQIIVQDGTGKLTYTSMQQNLDSAALTNITEVSRQVIFAITGTSKTMLGIEESGTTRETARVQQEKFVQKTIKPIARRIVSALNFDYRLRYPEYYKSEKVEISIKNEADPAVAKESFETQKLLFDSILDMVYSGYTVKSAEDFMNGEIEFSSLELDGQDAQDVKDETEENPEEGKKENPTEDSTEETKEPENELKSKPLTLDEIYQKHEEEELVCDCHNPHHGESLESWIDNFLLKDHITENGLSEFGKTVSTKLKGIYKRLLSDIRKIDLEALKNSKISKTNNEVTLVDVRTKEESDKVEQELYEVVKKALRNVAGIQSAERKAQNKSIWGLEGNINILGEKEVNQEIQTTAEKIAKSHTNTIFKDLVKEVQKQEDKLTKNDITVDDDKLQEAVSKTYARIAKQRASLVSEDTFVRGIGIGNLWTDYFLVKVNGRLQEARKRLVNFYPDPCEYCRHFLNQESVPLMAEFPFPSPNVVDENGEPLEIDDLMFANMYGDLHPNCRCIHVLEFVDSKDKKENE